MDKPVVTAHMFLNFDLSFKDRTYELRYEMSRQLLNLLEILFIHGQKVVTKEFLYQVIWNDHENPKSAMQFTIHQLRKTLTRLYGEDFKLIVTTKEGYLLNPEYSYVTDIQDFLTIAQHLENTSSFTRGDYQEALKALALYRGRLFVTGPKFRWAGQLAEDYSNIFISLSSRACKYLLDQKSYSQLMSLARQLILKEPFYETLQYYYIKGLIEAGEYHQALKYYDEINEAFYKKLGMGLTRRFKELYEALEKDPTAEVMGLDEIMTLLKEEDTESPGGYYCSFNLFKHIYEIALKMSERDKKRYYLILLESDPRDDDKENPLSALKEDILSSIRASDVLAKINSCQFILLVNCRDQKDTYLIVDRIMQAFYRRFAALPCRLEYSVESLEERQARV